MFILHTILAAHWQLGVWWRVFHSSVRGRMIDLALARVDSNPRCGEQ
jgi:hypothetical protein